MSTTLPEPPPPAPDPAPVASPFQTVADLIEQLGGISPSRIRMNPPPGTATERDVLGIRASEKRLFELIDGVLVEKGMGYREALLAAYLIQVLGAFVHRRQLGLVVGPDGMLRLTPNVIRVPDVSFISWSQIPGGRVPAEAVPAISPTLAVEVLSESNTRAEMQRKRREYLTAGGRLVWEVDPDARTVAVYAEPDAPVAVLGEAGTLDGGDVLPGFTLPLRDLFAVLDQEAPEQQPPNEQP